MKTMLGEVDALCLLKDSAVNEPELPLEVQIRLWKRVVRDVSTSALVGAGATTALDDSSSACAGATTALDDADAGGAVTAVASRGLLPSGKIVAARFALWSAPALVLGAALGVAGQRALAESSNAVSVEGVGAKPATTMPLSSLESSRGQSEQTNTDAQSSEPVNQGALRTNERSAPRVNADADAPAPRVEPRAVSALARERAVLDRARSALAAGEAARALEQAKRHAREFPNGILSEEREAITVNVLVRLGRYDQANQHAASFRVRYPRSLLMHSVEAAMAAVPKE